MGLKWNMVTNVCFSSVFRFLCYASVCASLSHYALQIFVCAMCQGKVCEKSIVSTALHDGSLNTPTQT